MFGDIPRNTTILVENEKVVSKNEQIAYLFNTYFNNVTNGLNIKRWLTSNLPSKDPLVNAIGKHEIHPSILKTKSVFKSIRLFDFSFVSSDDISKIITSSDSTKKTRGVIPKKKLLKLQTKKFVRTYRTVSTSLLKRTSSKRN